MNRLSALANMPRLEVVAADAGHAVNIEAAAVFNEAVSDFVGRHTGGER